MNLIPLDVAPQPQVQLGPIVIIIVLAVIAAVVALLLVRYLRRR
ncbi:hypothetical protein [Microlunatus speluncae]|nr:hypothetical protein [Microlunatus speluncae]